MADNQNIDAIRDQVNGITLGPSRTENGGQVLDVSQMSPEAAGNQLNQQAMALMQQNQQQNQQMIAATQQQNQQLMQGLTQAIQGIGAQNQQQQVNPLDGLQLTPEDQAELGNLNDPVSKTARLAAETAKQEALGLTQNMITEHSTATDARIGQLEAELAKTRQMNDSNFRTQLDGLAMQFGINMDTLATNAQWQAILNQPVSQFDRTPVRDKINEAVAAYDLSFFRVLLGQFAQQHGGNHGVTGTATVVGPEHTMGSNPHAMGQQPMQQPVNYGTMNQQPAINSQAGTDIRELEAAFGQIEEQRANLKRQLMDERSITREYYTEQSNQLMELETQIRQKYATLTGQGAAA